MSDQQHRGRSKSRSKSKSRKNSADAGDKKSETVTTINSEKTITQNHHKNKEGNSKEPNPKQMTTEEMEKEVERRRKQSAEQSAKDKKKNIYADAQISASMEKLLKKSQKLRSAYDAAKQAADDQWNESRITVDYDNLDEDDKKKHDKECKRHYNAALRQVFTQQWVTSLILSHKAAQKLANEHFKEHADRSDEHYQAQAAHVHALYDAKHMHKHNPDAVPSGPMLHQNDTVPAADAMRAQMSYDNALWGAATHTRAGDSLRYL
jgi:hypothetical protein